MTATVRIGVLTPSSNTILEPTMAAMLADLPDVTAHFGRFKVTEITLTPSALAQFDEGPILAAASLLADAKPHVITWSGTSAAWLGFDADHRLVAALERAAGAPGCTSMLAMNAALAQLGARRIAVVTPYIEAVQARILANYVAAGYEIVAERHLGDRGNFSFAEFSVATVVGLCREVAAAKPEAICVICTNLRGAATVADLEAELGIPIVDSIAAATWQALSRAGADPSRVRGWGRLFALPAG